MSDAELYAMEIRSIHRDIKLLEDRALKLETDMYDGDGKRNPSVTTRLSLLESGQSIAVYLATVVSAQFLLFVGALCYVAWSGLKH